MKAVSAHAAIERRHLRVSGVVQGVGFRPFVYGLAQELALAGFVGNDASGVFIEVEGTPAALAAFEARLCREAPPLARIDGVSARPIAARGERGFSIAPSLNGAHIETWIAPDAAICPDCLRELFDPADRRYRYPFINCTHCGPRYTIVRALPYDRPNTTMAPFRLCPMCEAEYHDPANRRFHAQPIACPQCGPWVEFWERDGRRCARDEAIEAAQAALRAGKIVAVKGLGGYHLACDAANEDAVRRLRERKGRDGKPFALMMRDLALVERFAVVTAEAADRLQGRERPIVLLPRREPSALAASVAPGCPELGVMLPYTPLHYLLIEDLPLVMTSGNLSGEPIVTDDEAAFARLGAVADAFLTHNRAIETACDDSVLRFAGETMVFIRRSRGYAPAPLRLPLAVPPLLAVGGELKNVIGVARDRELFLSQHIGDLENFETLTAARSAVDHLCDIFRIAPERVICDLHPGYFSARLAETLAAQWSVPLLRVQHHHAHIAAAMAECGLDGKTPVIGLSFDGTGFGLDGAVWGGEVLIADYAGFERFAHLAYIPLPGGDAAIRHPYRQALAHLWAAGIDWADDLAPVVAASAEQQRILRRQFEAGLQTTPTSSMGRLFDAISALAGLCQTISYEAEAAIKLETVALAHGAAPAGRYHFDLLDREGTVIIDPAPLLRAVVADIRAGKGAGWIAAGFHAACADLVLALCLHLRAVRGLNGVALSGGVWQNALLLRHTLNRLREAGFDLYLHRQVPPNDGGLALGQTIVGGLAPLEVKDNKLKEVL